MFPLRLIFKRENKRGAIVTSREIVEAIGKILFMSVMCVFEGEGIF